MASNQEDLKALIERYNREMMEQYASAVSSGTPTEAPVSPAPPIEIEEQPTSPSIEESDNNLQDEWIDTGRLQVRVSTENQAVPIPGAVITVTKQQNGQTELIRTVIADDSGLTPLMDLATKDRRLSLVPNNLKPYAEYTVDVTASGYFPKRFVDLPIYGGVTAIQNVSMIPLPESGSDDTVLSYPQSGPVGL